MWSYLGRKKMETRDGERVRRERRRKGPGKDPSRGGRLCLKLMRTPNADPDDAVVQIYGALTREQRALALFDCLLVCERQREERRPALFHFSGQVSVIS